VTLISTQARRTSGARTSDGIERESNTNQSVSSFGKCRKLKEQ